MTQTPADWYPDPRDPANARFWDGAAWTPLTRPLTAPPPAGPPMTALGALAPKRSRRGLWITLSVIGVLVLGIAVTAVVLVAGKFAPISQDYSGAPVTSSDQPSAGHVMVISDTTSVAAEFPAEWRDAQEYVDINSVMGDLGPGASTVGTWFTAVPDSADFPEFVILLEFAPSIGGAGTLQDIHEEYLSGIRTSLPTVRFGAAEDYTSSLGLTGLRSDGTFTLPDQGVTGNLVVASLAHGRRVVLFAWTSYDGPVDEAGVDSFLGSLRVDT